jgi:Flp pilus assembly protein TadD
VSEEAGSPEGGVYEWYQRGMQLLSNGDPAAAATLLGRAAEAEPGSRSVREALARAQYDAGRYDEAIASFEQLIT